MLKRITQLDGVRGLAILSVFLHHSLHIKLMWMGVDLFFVLSGFLITGVLIEARGCALPVYLSRFYERRARRILPPYIVVLVLVSILFGIGWMQHWYLYIFLTNLILPLGISHPSALDPLWSLAVEEQFYLVWPFAVFFAGERRLRHLAIMLILLAPILRGALHFHHHWPIYTLTPFRMDLLAVGAFLFLIRRTHEQAIAKWGFLAGLGLMTAGLFSLALLGHAGITTFGNTRIGNVCIYEASLLICSGFMVYALSERKVGWLKNRALRFIGRISYMMYLIHVAALDLTARWFTTEITHALVAFIVTVTFAATSWFLMEKRLLQKTPVKEPAAV
ncbi:MAG: acyltransferase [Acidobacteriota bacterium]|nr:acyltransferase [Acidobacteriota bacterium]